MQKALAVLRTLFLVFIIGLAIRAYPFWRPVARTFDEQYSRCANDLAQLLGAAWMAIGWITFETLLGWFLATRAQRAAAKAHLPPPGEPPFAPPRG